MARGCRWQEREAYRSRHRRRHRHAPLRFPQEMSELPPFPVWMTQKVKALQDIGEDVAQDIQQYAQPPERFAVTYKRMYAFGQHFRVRSAESGLVTCDSCVLATFSQQLRWGLCNGRLFERVDEYVGYIDEILELDYRNHCTTVFVCDWVRPTTDARSPNMKRDEYGFLMANFNHMDGRVHSNSFAFPMHCQQVFFSEDPYRPGWKIVCRVDVRGRRRPLPQGGSGGAMLDIGDDMHFVGLQPEVHEEEPLRESVRQEGVYVNAVLEGRLEEELLQQE